MNVCVAVFVFINKKEKLAEMMKILIPIAETINVLDFIDMS